MDIEQRMDPELREVFRSMPPLTITGDPVAARRMFADMLKAMGIGQVRNDEVSVEDHTIPGVNGSPGVPVRVYASSHRQGPSAGLLWIHGGGFIVGNLDQDDLLCTGIVQHVGCVVVSVDYRLAPEHPFPAAPDDCFLALKWMVSVAPVLGLDPARLAVGGGSAGGCLAAAVALMARDFKGPDIVFQLLIYPVLDDRLVTPSSYDVTDRRTWNRESAIGSWNAYLGAKHGGDVSPYAAPARAADLTGLPPTYILVAGLDLLRDEAIEYASRLMQAGVTTDLHVFSGTAHAFDVWAPEAAVTRRAISEYRQAIRLALRR